MLELDGSVGGGQLMRTALTLSAATGQPFEMTDIRGGRETPGLRPQHAASVALTATITNAEMSEVGVGTETLEFTPESISGGEYEVDVGTAGSLTLLFDTVLPLALVADEPIRVYATGGTDVLWSPSLAFLASVKLPLLRRWGLWAAVDTDRRGFYPAGDGAATLSLAPSSPGPLTLPSRGSFRAARVYSVESADLADADVASRQATEARERLETAGLPVESVRTTSADSVSTGSAVTVRFDYEAPADARGPTEPVAPSAGFDSLGERGKPAEDVASDAVEDALSFHAGTAAVDRHLTDQLVVLVALAGGHVRIPAVTDHVESCVDLVGAFGFDVTVVSADDEFVLTAA